MIVFDIKVLVFYRSALIFNGPGEQTALVNKRPWLTNGPGEQSFFFISFFEYLFVSKLFLHVRNLHDICEKGVFFVKSIYNKLNVPLYNICCILNRSRNEGGSG